VRNSAFYVQSYTYQALFGAMYRQYAVTSYKLIRADQYADVIAWLQEYQRAHVAQGEA